MNDLLYQKSAKRKDKQKTYAKIISFKRTKEQFVEKLCNTQFPDYKNTFEDLDTSYSDFLLINLINCSHKRNWYKKQHGRLV